MELVNWTHESDPKGSAHLVAAHHYQAGMPMVLTETLSFQDEHKSVPKFFKLAHFKRRKSGRHNIFVFQI